MDRIWSTCPHTTLLTSGKAVGLPEGQMGNSEVGHLNIGAGFIVHQWISRIDKAIADGELAGNPILTSAIDHCIDFNRTLHIGGLVSDGGVHSHIRHIFALIEIAAARGLNKIAIDAFTDGRDTLPTSGAGFVANLEQELKTVGVGRIATVSGRYYAMDRDKRWERTQLAYDAIVSGSGPTSPSAVQAIQASYDAGVTDEFIVPVVIPNPDGPDGMQDGDVFMFANFRSDRGRQLTHALSDPDFTGFERSRVVAGTCRVITMTRYEEGLPVDVLFEPHDVVTPLAKVISDAGLAQFHCAETEKYPHVTFFINGGREEPFPGEDRTMIPSPKVATYDLQPEMSAIPVADATVAAIEVRQIRLRRRQLREPGHGRPHRQHPGRDQGCRDGRCAVGEGARRSHGGRWRSVGNRGSRQCRGENRPETGGPMTAHTTNPVPCVLVGAGQVKLRDGAILSSVAPTILELLGLPTPAEMTAQSLLDTESE